MTRFMLAAAIALFAATPALAEECAAELTKVDAALAANPKVTADKLMEAEKLRDQGEDLCDAGRKSESLTALTQAKAILGIK
ncbi:MAG: hypothetical protein ACKVOI_14480 [Dongiaceae bacterium]